MKDKWLYEFEVFDKKEIEEVEVSKNENGEEVKTTKKTIKPVSVKFKIKKPTRSLFEEAELFYGVKLAEGIKAGMLTRPLLAKRYSNDGGPLSDPDKQRYAGLYLQLFQKESEFQRLSINLDNLSKEERDDFDFEIDRDIDSMNKLLDRESEDDLKKFIDTNRDEDDLKKFINNKKDEDDLKKFRDEDFKIGESKYIKDFEFFINEKKLYERR